MLNTQGKGASDLYAVFKGRLEEHSVQRLVACLTNIEERKVRHIHLLFQSSGGHCEQGIFLYNFFKTFPIKIAIYNTALVESAATIAYLGADRRIVNTHGSFVVHRVLYFPKTAVTVEKMETALKGAKEENAKIGSILCSRTKLSEETWAALGDKEIVYSAKEAIKIGLANSVGDFEPPPKTVPLNFGY